MTNNSKGAVERFRSNFSHIANCVRCRGYLHLYDNQENAWKVKDLEAFLIEEVEKAREEGAREAIKEMKKKVPLGAIRCTWCKLPSHQCECKDIFKQITSSRESQTGREV